MVCSKNSPKKEVYNNTILSQETKKISNKWPNLILKEIREQEQNPKLVEGKES